MKKSRQSRRKDGGDTLETGVPERGFHGGLMPVFEDGKCLDAIQIHRLEQSFRDWTEGASRKHIRTARLRILVIFLLIRYTGAKLSEVLALNPFDDIDGGRHMVLFRDHAEQKQTVSREVRISEALSVEIQRMLTDLSSGPDPDAALNVDPGFVRRKFYERAQACGFSKQLGGPEMIRKARAVELMQSNMPLPAVQKMLGHSTPNLTSSYISFSEDEIQRVTTLFMERESSRKTSARNSFFGKIQRIKQGTIQSSLELITIDALTVTTIITNESVARLGLKEGKLVTAEVKAPWVMLQKQGDAPECSAENKFNGVVTRINKGRVNTEYIVRITDHTELCAIISSKSGREIRLQTGDRAWAMFNGYSVVLHTD